MFFQNLIKYGNITTLLMNCSIMKGLVKRSRLFSQIYLLLVVEVQIVPKDPSDKTIS